MVFQCIWRRYARRKQEQYLQKRYQFVVVSDRQQHGMHSWLADVVSQGLSVRELTSLFSLRFVSRQQFMPWQNRVPGRVLRSLVPSTAGVRQHRSFLPALRGAQALSGRTRYSLCVPLRKSLSQQPVFSESVLL